MGFHPVGLAALILCSLAAVVKSELTPPYFNLATGRKIYATATCGQDTDGPELYCKLVGANTENDHYDYSVIQGQVCDVCDPKIPDKNHAPEFAIDGTESWWQSPPLSRGMKYNEVNLTIDFDQEFHVAYLFIRMGNSPRPGLWTLEKSSDYGKTWSPWQHFSDTPTDCETYFGKDTYKPITRDDDVVCTTQYSKIVPLENGEIPVMLLQGRPSANNYFNSSVLQEWTRATNIRIRLLRTKNLLGHLMSVARQDPTVTRRYFYSIKDISIGGRCMCNGHADTCDVLDAKKPIRILACRCQHRTCGIQCNQCCPGFEQKKWRQNTNAQPFSCEPCNCHGHSNTCVYDEDVDRKGLSLDIHGLYDGGGVCQNCQDHTEGINCNKCTPKYYRPYGKHWNETDVCQPCHCDHFYSTGNCEEESGRCECRQEFQPPNCDVCAYGYYGYPNCRECQCNLNGTDGYHCEAVDGECPCKINFAGHYCKQCAEGYYAYPECKACHCSRLGSINNDCDMETGQCKCLSNFGGDSCERCKHGYFSYPDCKYCDCDIQGTESEICNKENGQCICREGYGGPRCDQCLPGFYNYPECKPCNCSTTGSSAITCDNRGKCNCLLNFAGKQCTLCSAGYYNYPECLPCNCDSHGSEGVTCNQEGQCSCLPNFDGKICDACREGFYNFPICEECNCDPAGVIDKFAGCGSVPVGELCQCKALVTGRICNECKPLYWNLNISNPEGCEPCHCHTDGTIALLDTCAPKTGQCTCKPYVQGRKCSQCKDGTFDLYAGNLFGCKDCNCDVGGSRSPNCDKMEGQCKCHPRITGRTCTQPLTTHFFPTLHQFQFEYEDGYTPGGAQVRYQYDDKVFSGFSGKGYAVFSDIQNEVINDIMIFKSSVYRMVIRYVNPTKENITASVVFVSENPLEVDQEDSVLLRPTKTPQFVTVAGSKGNKPLAIVLDPGQYKVTTKSNKHVMLDYFVLLPAAYYEASILTRKIDNPCELGNMEMCRHYKYASVSDFKPAIVPFVVKDGDIATKASEYYSDPEHLKIINHISDIPVISETQNDLKYIIDVPHSGRYVFVIDYISDKNFPDTYFVKVAVGTDREDYGVATLYPCLYSMSCRQPVIDDYSQEKAYYISDTELKPVSIYSDYDDFGRVPIISITAITIEKWSIDYVMPTPVCVIHDGQCTTPKFRSVPDSKKIEFESDHEDRIATHKPPDAPFDEKVRLIHLDHQNSTIVIESKVSEPGRYVVLVKYYQPYHPKYSVLYTLETEKQFYDGKFDVNHCPSSSGCRGAIRPSGEEFWFDIEDEFKFTLTNNRPQGLWLDYLVIVPIDQYNDDLLVEETFDQTKEFIQNCGQDHFHIAYNASEFCKKAVFSLTAHYNDGALQCNCTYDGSTSFECDPFGGQCPCKPNVIGRQCGACRTGFYGFPDCKPCDCPVTAMCEPQTGECICPPNVQGEKCDECKPYTYGFHQIIGCEDCNCNYLGVDNGNMQCDLYNGTCACRHNIEGRVCDQCSNGYYNFPRCDLCSCKTAGTQFSVCDKENGECLCKENVMGISCDRCKEGKFYLDAENPEGCTTCFCFGKTSRCDSAYLRVYNLSLLKNVSLNNVDFQNKTVDIERWALSSDEIFVNETTLVADFSLKDNDDGLVYFGVLDYLLGQNSHLSSYGGQLVYSLYFTTGLFGKALVAPDVILVGKKDILVHTSYEQPTQDVLFRNSVKMVETNFQKLTGQPVSRGDFMMVLRDLEMIYIRANYWEQTVLTQLSDAYLTLADEDEDNFNLYQQLPVEKCHCPPGYTGLSCEDCAPGYYRDPDGPYGGYCIPCDCNGHSDSCDCATGICKNCQHATTGDHCEECIEGYYGNATYGSPHDCMICACPLPFETNNFAYGCEISESGQNIHCECKLGYTGARCESCAPGFYGQPEVVGDYCKPCECSGNINPSEPGSCDTITGECILCLNNTSGPACNLCAPGFYGDAINLKDCKSCNCIELGTMECDSSVGDCKCHENVIGRRCDQCKPDHYGYDSGMGCRACDCGVASNSTQCDAHTGNCECKPGVTGRQCDRCGVDFWNYTQEGCTPCNCNRGYSRGFGCNPYTGQCECLPGVIGEKCDHCPHRWVLLKDEGCAECDGCHHALLDVTDALRYRIDPVVDDFKSVALAFFTSQKLAYYDNLAEKVRPEVEALDPHGINLNPGREAIKKLESASKTFVKNVGHTLQAAQESAGSAQILLSNVSMVYNDTKHAADEARDAILTVEALAKSFDTAASTKIESALQEAERILNKIMATTVDLEPGTKQLEKTVELLINMDELVVPIKMQNKSLDVLKHDIGDFNDKMEDLYNWSKEAVNRSYEVERLNTLNKEAFDNSQFDTVADQQKEAEKNIDDARKHIADSGTTLDSIDKNLEELRDVLDQLTAVNKHVDNMLPAAEKDFLDAKKEVLAAERRAHDLKYKANQLSDQYSNITANSEQAIKASTAYTDIFDAVAAAKNAATEAKYAAGNATDLNNGIDDRAVIAVKESQDLLKDASEALSKVHNDLEPHLIQSTAAVESISNLNKKTEKKLEEILATLTQLPTQLDPDTWKDSDKQASAALKVTKEALEHLVPVSESTPIDLEKARNISKDIDAAAKDISQVNSQLDNVNAQVPELAQLTDDISERQKATEAAAHDLDEQMEILKQQIESARRAANEISVGVKFEPSTILELKAPETLPLLSTRSKVSAYFNTKNPDGFLLYLGNDHKSAAATGSGPKNNDFMALDILNGYPRLHIDLGNGPELITNTKYVADGKWYQVIVDRVGSNAKLIIREELEDGTPQKYEVEQALPGVNNVFNVDRNSRLFVGGYPPLSDFTPPEYIRSSSYVGQIEELRIGDEPVGLWNFVDAQDNEGIPPRDKLVSAEAPPTGYRFNGNGYVVLSATQYNFRTRSSVQFRFKASKDTKDGLMFYYGRNESFMSVELQNGGVFFRYKLGKHMVSYGTESMRTYNDDQWHLVVAEREGRRGLLKVDDKPIHMTEDAGSSEGTLPQLKRMYFGGHPGRRNHPDIVKTNFDGCIDDVTVSGNKVDLGSNQNATGVRPGCPAKFSTTLAYRPHEFGFLRRSNVSSDNYFHINLKFKTKQKDGVIFYVTNHNQSAMIGLTLDDGLLRLRSLNQDVTSDRKFNDGEWHSVTVLHEYRLLLAVDDEYEYTSYNAPPRLDIVNGDIFFGGLPHNYKPSRGALSTLAYFTGCITDVTLNTEIVNFANSAEKVSGYINGCPSDILDYDPETVPQYFPGDKVEEGLVEPDSVPDIGFIPIGVPSTTSTTTSTTTTTTTTTSTTTTTEEPPTTTPPSTTTTTTTTTTKRPAPKIKEPECKLPIEPTFDVTFNEAGYRFRGARGQRLEINSLPTRIAKRYDFSLKFRSPLSSGLLFYAVDKRNTDFIAVYLHEGKIYHQLRVGPIKVNLSTAETYDDNEWHKVEFQRQETNVSLIIDSTEVTREDLTDMSVRNFAVNYPLYIGGVASTLDEELNANTLLVKGTLFNGCIKDLQFLNRDLEKAPAPYEVIPCSDEVENGLFFGKSPGFVKIFEHFSVGMEMSINFDFKPRTTNGLLFSVHGRNAWMILELVNDSIIFSVKNDEKETLDAVYTLGNNESFCDGKWRTVHAVKSKFVITLTVDSISSKPAIGKDYSTSTRTNRPLFMGGHPNLHKVPGFRTKAIYKGCIRNISVKGTPIRIKQDMIRGDVWPNICPLG